MFLFLYAGLYIWTEIKKSNAMKLKLKLMLLLTVIVILSSCTRSLTPYEAANGKRHNGKCLRVK